MNPILRILASYGYMKGVGDRFGGSNAMDDFRSLSDEYGRLRDERLKREAEGKSEPMDRIKAAFDQLKDMHKSDPVPAMGGLGLFPGAAVQPPSAMGTAQQFMAHPPAAPMQPRPPIMASSAPPAAPAPMPTPMPQPRPAEAPQADNPLMSFFKRNTALQQDPMGGGYIDPSAAEKAQAQPGILSALFGR
jgi:hypothetical protein